VSRLRDNANRVSDEESHHGGPMMCSLTQLKPSTLLHVLIVPQGRSFFVPGVCVNLQPRTSMTIHKNDQASVRIWAHNPDHHIYNNNGTWWLHYTAYPTPLTTQRLRRSLKTRDVTLARSRRDAVLAQLFSGNQETA
jgi:hypothetical protein